MPNDPGLVVVGHGPAGAAAAGAFRELDADAPVTVISDESLACYSRPRLPEVVAGKVSPEAICLHPPAWYQERRLELQLSQPVTELDLPGRRVLTRAGRVFPFRRLVLAMGAAPLEPPIPGLETPGVFVLRTTEDALAINEQAQGKQRAVLIGGGLLGLEAGYALCTLGLKVQVVEVAPWLLPRQTDPEASALLQARLRPLGFEFFLGAKVARVSQEQERVAVELAGGARLVADLVLVSAGIQPRVDLARAARLQVHRGIVVDDTMLTSEPGVYAAGDVAEWQGTIAGLWPAAQGMGRVAGSNAAGQKITYPGEVPSTMLKVVGVDLASQGEIHAPDASTVTRSDPDGGYWARLFLRDHRVIGSIQLGRTQGALQLKRLIDQKVDVTGFENDLLSSSFDFSRLPGFKPA